MFMKKENYDDSHSFEIFVIYFLLGRSKSSTNYAAYSLVFVCNARLCDEIMSDSRTSLVKTKGKISGNVC